MNCVVSNPMKNTSRLEQLRWLTPFAAVACIFIATDARAQDVPDPFQAYEESEKPPADNPKKADPGEESAPSPKPAETQTSIDRVDSATAEGNWQFSSGTSFSFDRSTNELIDGNEATNSTYLFRLDLGLGLYVWDRVFVEGTAGLMMRRLAREGNTSATEQDWVFQSRLWYVAPISQRVALISGIGLGGYFGSSTREVEIEGSTINEETSTAGFAGDLMVGPMYMLSDAAAFRVLLDFTWLVGREKVPSLDESLGVSATHFGLGVGYTHSF